jgi:hypothetical protein
MKLTSCDCLIGCPSCNNYKHSYSLEEFRRLISELTKQLQLSTQYKIAKRYNLVVETNEDVVFYFEKFNINDLHSFCHHNGTYTTIKNNEGNEICCKCKKPLAR